MGLSLLFIKTWLAAQWSRFVEEEKGAADIIAIVLVIAVVIALAILFRDKLGELFNSIFPTAPAGLDDASQMTGAGG